MHGQKLIQLQQDRQRLAEKKLKAKRKLYKEKTKNAKVQIKDYDKSARGYIIKTLLIQGAIPKYAFRCFSVKPRYYDMIRQMTCEGLIKENVRCGYRFIVFDDFEKSKTNAKGTYPPDYVNYFYNYINTDTGEIRKLYSSKKADIVRLYETTFMRPFMYNAGIKTLLEERPPAHKVTQLNLDFPIYYSSTEFKRMVTKVEQTNDIDLTKEQKKAKSILNSRTTGLIFSKGGTYQIYDLQDHLIEWYSGLEKRMATKVEEYVKAKAPEESKEQKSDVIVYAKDTNTIRRIVENERKKIMQKFIYIDYSFNHFFILPLTVEGVWHTHEMTTDEWMINSHKRLNLTYDDIARADTCGVVCDAYKDGLYILNMTIPDFCKIKQFINASKVRKDKSKFLIYCYPYQEELAKLLCEDTCNIKVIEQPRYEREQKINRNGL